MGLGRFVRDVGAIVSTRNLMRRGLIRLGHVSSVDAAAGTVVIGYPGEPPPKSRPMPWMQRSTERRPPSVGDHALVFDPSLGLGPSIAITGLATSAVTIAGLVQAVRGAIKASGERVQVRQ